MPAVIDVVLEDHYNVRFKKSRRRPICITPERVPDFAGDGEDWVSSCHKPTRKVALVSGGSRGLGAQLVAGFFNRQYGVATLSRTKTSFITDLLRARKRRRLPLECGGWTRS